MSFGINQYRTARVQTASPVGVLVQLYDGAIRFLREAAQHMDEGDIAQKGVKLSKAHRIVSELQATLDRERRPNSVISSTASMTSFFTRLWKRT